MFRFPWLLLIVLVAVRTEDNGRLDGKAAVARQGLQEDAALSHGIPIQRCYSCSDCEHIQHNTSIVSCSYNEDTAKMHKCVVYVEKYKAFGKDWYVRGCATEKGLCSEIKKNHENAQNEIVKLLSCNECEGDKCNGVSRSLPLAFLYFVVTPTIFKIAMS